MTNTVHAGDVWYSEERQKEIKTCLNCPLPECESRSSKCPLKAAETERRRERERRRYERRKREDARALIAAWWAVSSKSDKMGCET